MLRRLLAHLLNRRTSGKTTERPPVLDPEQAARPLASGPARGRQARVFDPEPPRPDHLSDEAVDLPVVDGGEWRGE